MFDNKRIRGEKMKEYQRAYYKNHYKEVMRKKIEAVMTMEEYNKLKSRSTMAQAVSKSDPDQIDHRSRCCRSSYKVVIEEVDLPYINTLYRAICDKCKKSSGLMYTGSNRGGNPMRKKFYKFKS